jgi:hypothetical protein
MGTGGKIGAVVFAIIFTVVGASKGVSGSDLFVLGAIGGGVGGLIGSFVGLFLEPVVFKMTQKGRKSCVDCKHFIKFWKCKAFPESIPSEIMLGRVEHDKPYEGDHGIQYAPAEWSKPMSKSKIMAVANMDSHERFQEFAELYNATVVERDGLVLFKFRLDNMDEATRLKFEKV